jgi:hypothetical protein
MARADRTLASNRPDCTELIWQLIELCHQIEDNQAHAYLREALRRLTRLRDDALMRGRD